MLKVQIKSRGSLISLTKVVWPQNVCPEMTLIDLSIFTTLSVQQPNKIETTWLLVLHDNNVKTQNLHEWKCVILSFPRVMSGHLLKASAYVFIWLFLGIVKQGKVTNVWLGNGPCKVWRYFLFYCVVGSPVIMHPSIFKAPLTTNQSSIGHGSFTLWVSISLS